MMIVPVETEFTADLDFKRSALFRAFKNVHEFALAVGDLVHRRVTRDLIVAQ